MTRGRCLRSLHSVACHGREPNPRQEKDYRRPHAGQLLRFRMPGSMRGTLPRRWIIVGSIHSCPPPAEQTVGVGNECLALFRGGKPQRNAVARLTPVVFGTTAPSNLREDPLNVVLTKGAKTVKNRQVIGMADDAEFAARVVVSHVDHREGLTDDLTVQYRGAMAMLNGERKSCASRCGGREVEDRARLVAIVRASASKPKSA